MRSLMLAVPLMSLLLGTGARVSAARSASLVRNDHARAQGGDTAFAPEVVALGAKIFQGKAAGGLCFSCHGANAKGMKGLGSNLTDATWLHGDGSYAFIVSTVEKGIQKPKEGATPMPPKGGAPLTGDQIRAVAAYVYSLQQPARRPRSDRAGR